MRQLTDMMKLQPFGNTGLDFPPLVFGSSALGNLFKVYSQEVKNAILEESFKHTEPLTVFDTAGKYGAGLALEVLGNFLKSHPMPKERLVISNKLGWVRTPLKTKEPTFEPGIWKGIQHDAVQKISYEGILECFEKDNQLLGQHVPQLVSVHDPDEYLDQARTEREKNKRFGDVLGAYKALAELKSRGLVAGIGVGAKKWETIREIYDHVKLDYVMVANSLTLISHPTALLDFIHRLRMDNVGIINAAVFQSGFLVGEDYYDYRPIDYSDSQDLERLAWRKSFFGVCKQYEVDPDHACIQFALSVPGVNSVALSITDPSLIVKNLRSATEKLPQAFWDELKSKGIIQKLDFI
ncbi:aldo/keto reductase [Negadavirga shengliensis]|uniref:Aldo/keto reductase n=1 Tax=Negadavirga shengliensis TaxID=1389218 RepID=A0ABV9T791_9BACT